MSHLLHGWLGMDDRPPGETCPHDRQKKEGRNRCAPCQMKYYQASDGFAIKVFVLVQVIVQLVVLVVSRIAAHYDYERDINEDLHAEYTWSVWGTLTDYWKWFGMISVGLALLCFFIAVCCWFMDDHGNPQKEKRFSKKEVDKQVEDKVQAKLKELAVDELDTVDVLIATKAIEENPFRCEVNCVCWFCTTGQPKPGDLPYRAALKMAAELRTQLPGDTDRPGYDGSWVQIGYAKAPDGASIPTPSPPTDEDD